MPAIEFKVKKPITVDQFLDVLHASTLALRRPRGRP